MHEEVCRHNVQDLELDIPDAAHFVALFLGRATVDEVLPPAFLTAVLQRMHDDSLGVQVVRSVGESAPPPSPQRNFVDRSVAAGEHGTLSTAPLAVFSVCSYVQVRGGHLRKLPFCLLALRLAHLWLPAGHLLGAKHAAERLQRCWAHPVSFSIQHLRSSFQVCIRPCISATAQSEDTL